MSQKLFPNTFLASDGHVYTTDGKYVLQNNNWVPCQSVDNCDTSAQQNQSSQAEPGPSPESVSGDDISAAMFAQFGQIPPSQLQLPRQPATNSFQPTGRPAAPPIDVDPSFRAAKDRHIMIGAFVDALDALSGRKS